MFVIGKYVNTFWVGGRKFSVGGIFHSGGSSPRVNFSGEVLHRGNLPEFLYEISLVSCFLFADSILRVKMLRVTVRGKVSSGLNCLENK